MARSLEGGVLLMSRLLECSATHTHRVMRIGADIRCDGAVTANETAAVPRPEPESRTGESSTARVAGALARESMRRPWYTYAISYAVAVLLIVPAVWLCDWILPGFHVAEPGWPIVFAAVLALVGVVLQPLLVWAAVRLGWLGVLLLAFVGQAAIVLLTAAILPHVTVDDFWTAFLVAVVVGLVSTVLGWFGSAGTGQVLVSRLVASAQRRPAKLADPEVEGVVFVQMDGVPFPVLQMAITAGTVPTLTRWVRSGTHRLYEWTPKLPATTPASQMGILHGVIDGIPAFRWYDRANDRVLVANKPADAAVIEADMTTGKGLLVDDGVSISNLFTGDAPTAVLTMSRRARGGEAARQAVAQFVMSPAGLTRALSRSVSELTRDRFQTRRAISRDVLPRCERNWETALLRCVTNGALRDLNTILVSQHMLKGVRSIYVDFVDYDEIAHHAGILRDLRRPVRRGPGVARGPSRPERRRLLRRLRRGLGPHPGAGRRARVPRRRRRPGDAVRRERHGQG